MSIDYTQVTEVAGDEVTHDQIQRMINRYHWARQFSKEKEILELACGTGQGLGYIAAGGAKRVIGGDISKKLLWKAREHYGTRLPFIRLDAQLLPLRGKSVDVVVLFEAIYYLREAISFVRECHRVLRPKGVLLICAANKDLPDFNPSPYSIAYFSPVDFVNLLTPQGFHVECFGDSPVDYRSFKQRCLSLVKKAAVRMDLLPKTMSGKKILKRLAFGELVPLPAEIGDGIASPQIPSPIPNDQPDTRHKVIFAVARKD